MSPTFIRLNNDWNAEPNAPGESAQVDGRDVLLKFDLNPYRYEEFVTGDRGALRFENCACFRLGATNDEGWYRGQCRFSGLAPAWGEFYAVVGDLHSTDGPSDWIVMEQAFAEDRTHFLFYFRDRTFECVAERCVIEPSQDNSLFSAHKVIPQFRLGQL